MDHINYTYEKLFQKRINNAMAAEKRQYYKPLSKHNPDTVSSSSSTTCTHRVTHLKNDDTLWKSNGNAYYDKVTYSGSLLTKMLAIVNRIMMVTVNLLWNQLSKKESLLAVTFYQGNPNEKHTLSNNVSCIC
jgi:hypothetical protein